MKIILIAITIFIVLFEQSLCQSDIPWIGEAKDVSWLKTHERMINQTLTHKNDIQIVFIGDSITEKWTTDGKKLWDKYYVPRHAYNYGIGGDRTENVIYRIENKEFDGLNPKVVIVKIGTNNFAYNASLPAADVARGIHKIVQLLEMKMEKSPILLLGILPREGTTQSSVQQVNQLISKYGDNKKVYFLDMSSHFLTADGKRITNLFHPGSAHLTEKGYQVWHDVMEPLLIKVLAKH